LSWIREGLVTSLDSLRGSIERTNVRHSTRGAREREDEGGEGDAKNGDRDEESRARVGGILRIR
jgi:hypothetical protein